MNTLKMRFRRLVYRLKHDFLNFDNTVLILTILLCLAWTWGAIAAMTRNWELEQRLISSKKTLALLELEVDTIALENEYYASEEYQELAARRQLNKKLPGETLIYLPKNTDAAKNKHQTAPVETPEPSNFSQWMSFLFGIKL